MDEHDYAIDFALTMLRANTDLVSAQRVAIAADFDERMHDDSVRVSPVGFFATEWEEYLKDIGGYANFDHYADALLAHPDF